MTVVSAPTRESPPEAQDVAPHELLAALDEAGFDQYSGVPCSFLGGLIAVLDAEGEGRYLPATNEGEAVAISAGARLAGRRPVVIMQNSGLGNAVNPLSSLCHALRIPVLLLITWRGRPGEVDEPQHELMGQITQDLLASLRIPTEVLPQRADLLGERFRHAQTTMTATGMPYAFLVPRGAVGQVPGLVDGRRPQPHTKASLTRAGAIGVVLDGLEPTTLVVATTGKTSRELERDRDRPTNLYVVGSMGCASSIALGLALARPGATVVCLDGDGAALMRLEAMATIGSARPANLVHVLLDNGCYDSTGAQRSVSPDIDFMQLAASCGYSHSAEVYDEAGLRTFLEGPSGLGARFVRVHVRPGSDPQLGRPALSPAHSVQRFSRALLP